jgi:transcriptional regulator with XRE-family HTH domain
MKNWDFYRKLHERGMTTEKLAAALQTSHSHISQVINGTRGAHSRKHMAPLLTAEERALLGWNERGEIVPQGTLSQVKQ